MRRLLFINAFSLFYLCCGVASSSADEAKVAFFEKKIRPVLVQRCYKCHSEKTEGGLRLNSSSAMIRGGDSGAAVKPGKPGESLLLKAIHYGGDSFQMPPDGKLQASVIADFETWIERGAIWPAGDADMPTPTEPKPFVITKEQREFWSFQPVAEVTPPSVRNNDWPQNDIDRFVLRRLEADNLNPSPRASKRELIRRVTFDLTGLPPTAEEVEDFLSNESPDAFSKVVDRLLQSPQYGEHWARHWLDGVRYVSDVGYYNFSDLGWRYRDWVVRALNDDLPYDQFVVHQIAGDLLPPPRGEAIYADGLIATGVMAMGNYDDQESNKEKLYAEVIDDQIDLVGRQFLGLTISCARCHDHKFDPISNADYYALGGIFLSSQVLESKSRIGAHRLKLQLDNAEQQSQHNEHLALIKAVEEEIKAAKGDAEPTQLEELQKRLETLRRETPALRGETIGIAEGPHQMGRHNTIGDMPIYIRGNPFSLGEKVPRRFPQILAGENQTPICDRTSQSGRLELAKWIANQANPLTARVMANRIWQKHFGAGIVRTPSDFGSRGERPTHPLLLDFLAREFTKSNWSIKAMHRLIVNSAAYQQSCVSDSQLVESDPENRLLARFSPRRLKAEELYDALLLVSGRLKSETGRGKGNRALYQRIGHLHPTRMANLFDAPTAGTMSPSRGESTSATQALYLMNDGNVIAAARALHDRVNREADTPELRVSLAYRTLFGRTPTDDELAAGVAYLKSSPDDRHWTLMQVLLCSNEFIYLY